MGWAFLISLIVSIMVVNNDYLQSTSKGFSALTILATIMLGIIWLVS
jgi:hypothetical protein